MLSRTTLIWLNRLLWTALVGAVLLLGLVVSLGQHYIPYVESHQQELVDAVNRRTGLHLSVGHISGRWQRLSPHFVIDDLRLYNPQYPDQVVLRIEHAEVQLGIFRSISARTFAISRLLGNGVHVQLAEAPRGHWQLPGFTPQSGSNYDALLDLLLAIYRANLRDMQFDLQFFGGGGEAHVAGNRLQLQRAGDFRRINLELTVAEKAAPFTLVVEARGDPRREEAFAARGHAGLRSVDLAPLLPAAKAFGVDLQHGLIDGEVWLDWRPHQVVEIRGQVALQQLDIAGFSDLALAPVTAIKTQFLLRTEPGKQQLWLPQLSASWSGVQLDFRQLLFSASSAKPNFYELAVPELRLATLRDALLASDVISAHVRDIVSTMQPHGTLRNVRLDLPLRAEQRNQLRLRAQLADIEVHAWQGAPGVEGGGGYVDAHLDNGVVDLVSDGYTMDFPHVYHEPLHFDRVRGRIAWHVEDNRILMNSGPIAVQGDAGRATAQFALDLPMQHGGTPLMTLMVGLRDSAAQYRDRFVPYTLQPALLTWLQQAVRGGQLPVGGFVYRGSLLADDHAARTVQLFLDVKAGELAYQPDWPPLHHLMAGVWVDDGDLIVRAPSARMFDHIAINNVVVEMQHPPSGSWLTVRGDTLGEGADVLRLLRESPVHKRVGTALDAWRWRGTVSSQFDLGIPIGGDRASELRIDSTLGPGTLTLADQRIVVTDLYGPLNYHSDSGLQSTAISAKWYGKPLAIKVATATSGDMKIEASGLIGMADLQEWLQQPLFDYAEGATPFDATLHIAGDNSAVVVHTDLVGAALQLPPPYTKPAEQNLPLDVRMSLGSQRELIAELSDWADLRLRWNNQLQVDAGILRLGKSGKTQFIAQQMIITGAVPTLEFDAWRDVIARDRAGQPRTQATSDNALALYLRDLRFDTLSAAGQTLNSLVLSGHRDDDGWQLGLGAQQLTGTLHIPDSAQQPWNAKLSYLRLPALATTPTAAVENNLSTFAEIDPAKIIPIDVTIGHLWRGNEELGSLSMQLRPVEAGLRVDNLSGQLRNVTITGRGAQPASMTWTRRDGIDHSEFNARLQVDDVGVALQRWHYEPVLTSKFGEVDIALRWPGAPDQFQFARAEGDAQLRIDDGRFLKASSSASGALKVVGIFNFANFLKRLQLDFSDVFKDGVSFDNMKGGLAAHQGILQTTDPVEIKSPSSRFRLAGQVDFNTDQTDMELVATLPIASNLPWVAALAGGLPVAAGVYVASKIFENQVDKVASAAYDISGPWADPKVKLRRVFDDKLHQKSVEQGMDKEQGSNKTNLDKP
jgi:uncharacterized protein (TIGR02099 family)